MNDLRLAKEIFNQYADANQHRDWEELRDWIALFGPTSVHLVDCTVWRELQTLAFNRGYELLRRKHIRGVSPVYFVYSRRMRRQVKPNWRYRFGWQRSFVEHPLGKCDASVVEEEGSIDSAAGEDGSKSCDEDDDDHFLLKLLQDMTKSN